MNISPNMKKRLDALAKEADARSRQKNEMGFYLQMSGELHARLKRAAHIWHAASMAEFTRQAVDQFCTSIEETCCLPPISGLPEKKRDAGLRIPLSKLRG